MNKLKKLQGVIYSKENTTTVTNNYWLEYPQRLKYGHMVQSIKAFTKGRVDINQSQFYYKLEKSGWKLLNMEYITFEGKMDIKVTARKGVCLFVLFYLLNT